MNDVVDVLVKARASIESPKNWGQKSLACRGANTMCALNAIAMAIGPSVFEETLGYDDNLPGVLSLASAIGGAPTLSGFHRVYRFNDTHSHAEVLAAFDRAIATERAKRGTKNLIDEALAVEPAPPTSATPVLVD